MRGLPKIFCWTRFGAESGWTVDDIVRHEKNKRQTNDGLFWWGIGAAVGPSIRTLVAAEPLPLVVFTPVGAGGKRRHPRGLENTGIGADQPEA